MCSIIWIEEQEATLWGTISLQNKQCKWAHWHGIMALQLHFKRILTAWVVTRTLHWSLSGTPSRHLFPLLQSKDLCMDLREFINIIGKDSTCNSSFAKEVLRMKLGSCAVRGLRYYWEQSLRVFLALFPPVASKQDTVNMGMASLGRDNPQI